MSIRKPVKRSSSKHRVRRNGKLEEAGQRSGQRPATERKPTKQPLARQNLHGLLKKVIFVPYANDLRRRYPGQTIRNAAVFDSVIRECSRLGYIQLVRSKEGGANLPNLIVRILKRVRHYPIWIMGPNFPDEPMDMLKQLRPSIKDGKIMWHHHPTRRKPTWRNLE